MNDHKLSKVYHNILGTADKKIIAIVSENYNFFLIITSSLQCLFNVMVVYLESLQVHIYICDDCKPLQCSVR